MHAQELVDRKKTNERTTGHNTGGRKGMKLVKVPFVLFLKESIQEQSV